MTTQQGKTDTTPGGTAYKNKVLNIVSSVAGFAGPEAIPFVVGSILLEKYGTGINLRPVSDPRSHIGGPKAFHGQDYWEGGCTDPGKYGYYSGTTIPHSSPCYPGKCYDHSDAGQGRIVDPCPDYILYPKNCHDGSGDKMYCATDTQSPHDAMYPKNCFDHKTGRNWYCEGDTMDPDDPNVQKYNLALSKVSGQLDMLSRKFKTSMTALNDTYHLGKLSYADYTIQLANINSINDRVTQLVRVKTANVLNPVQLADTDVSATDAIQSWNDIEFEAQLQRLDDIYTYETAHLNSNDAYGGNATVLNTIWGNALNAIKNGSIQDGTDADGNAAWLRVTAQYYSDNPIDIPGARQAPLPSFLAGPDPSPIYNTNVVAPIPNVYSIPIVPMRKDAQFGKTFPVTSVDYMTGKTVTFAPPAKYDKDGNLLTSTGVSTNSPTSRAAVDALYSKDYKALNEYYNIGVMDLSTFQNRCKKLITIHKLAYANLVKGFMPLGAYLDAKTYVLNYNSKGSNRFVLFPPLTAAQKYRADLDAWKALHPGTGATGTGSNTTHTGTTTGGSKNTTSKIPIPKYDKDGNLLTSTGVSNNSPTNRAAIDALYSKDYQALNEYFNIGVMDSSTFQNRCKKLITIHQLAYANLMKGFFPVGAYLDAKTYVLGYNSKGSNKFVLFPPLTAAQKYKVDLDAWTALHPGQSVSQSGLPGQSGYIQPWGGGTAPPTTTPVPTPTTLTPYQQQLAQYNKDLAAWQAAHPGQSATSGTGTGNSTTLTPDQQYQQELVQYNKDLAVWQASHPGQSAT